MKDAIGTKEEILGHIQEILNERDELRQEVYDLTHNLGECGFTAKGMDVGPLARRMCRENYATELKRTKATLNGIIADKNAKIDMLNSAIKHHRTNHHRLEEENADLKARYKEAAENRDHFRDGVKEYTDEIISLEAKVDALKARNRGMTAENVRLKEICDGADMDRDAARAEIARLKEEIRKQDRIIEAKDAQLGMRAERITELNGINQEMNDARGKPARVHIEATGNVVVTSSSVHPGDEGPVRETE